MPCRDAAHTSLCPRTPPPPSPPITFLPAQALAASLRTELEPRGVHVGAVAPGLVKSNLMERAAFYGRDPEEERR